jgi:hypothetical protein
MTTIRINRAPVLTLWAAVVAERIGLPNDTSLTAGQAVAGMTAHSKGVRLGIYAQPIDSGTKPVPPKPDGATGPIKEFMLLGRIVHIVDTKDGPRAINKGELGKPAAIEKYLRSKFGEPLDAARTAMEALAATLPPKELNTKGFHLYEQFRPEVPSDEKGSISPGIRNPSSMRSPGASTNGRGRLCSTKHQLNDFIKLLHRPVESATLLGRWVFSKADDRANRRPRRNPRAMRNDSSLYQLSLHS